MFADVLKIARSMKRPIVHVSHNYMLGTDEEFNVLSMIMIDSDIPRPFTARVKDIVTPDKKEKFVKDHPIVFWAQYISLGPLGDEIYINGWDEPELEKAIRQVQFNLNGLLDGAEPVFHQERLEQDPSFMEKIKLKVSDGQRIEYFDCKYPISFFNKVHAINATDKVSVSIYELLDSNLFEFTVDKKKYTIKEYIRSRKL